MKVAGDDTGTPVSPSRRMSQCSEGFREHQESSRKARLASKKKPDTFGFIV